MGDAIDSDKDKETPENKDEAASEEQPAASEITDTDLEQITGGLTTIPEGDPWFKKRGNLTQNDLKWTNRTKIIKGDSGL